MTTVHSQGSQVYNSLRERVAEFQASADLRWKSDMRAIKMWQKANPGNDFVCPSQDDLCVWLMDKLTPPKWDDLTQDEKRGVEIICDDVPYHAQIYSEIIALISRRAAAAYGGKE